MPELREKKDRVQRKARTERPALSSAQIGTFASQAGDATRLPLSEVELEFMSDTVVALLAHYGGPNGSSISRERIVGLVDHVLMVLVTGARLTEQTPR